MNLLFSDEQIRILDSLREFLSREAAPARFRPPAPQTGNTDNRLWERLGELGWFGIALDEDRGGIGLGTAEEMLAYREFGRHLLSPCILGVTLAAHLAAGSNLAYALVAGRMPVALATPRGRAELGPLCSGDFHVFDASSAQWILACDHKRIALLQREAFTDVTDVPCIDALLSLNRARLCETRPLLWSDGATGGLYQRAHVLISAYALGLAEAARDMAVAYAKTREQFGKPIGAFQAIKHICADMAIRCEAALCQVIVAALTADDESAAPEFHATAARLVANDAALRNAAQNIQVHGAIGFTADGEAHLYLKRAHVMDQLWGDIRLHRERMLAARFPG